MKALLAMAVSGQSSRASAMRPGTVYKTRSSIRRGAWIGGLIGHEPAAGMDPIARGSDVGSFRTLPGSEQPPQGGDAF
ncbi:hypothetical protein [Thiohalocapsa sp. ML1]|uniref:hypothetical protein n=1 Tax=Thiohalocapsa sp. ML1 TaxID=1431688 RepID=UPI00073210E4|nr:hypothetical protein [Thiohalocapsa sp. ML1]